MYRKSWRYYRDSIILWSLFILMVVTVGLTLKQPIYWLAVLLLWGIGTRCGMPLRLRIPTGVLPGCPKII